MTATLSDEEKKIRKIIPYIITVINLLFIFITFEVYGTRTTVSDEIGVANNDYLFFLQLLIMTSSYLLLTGIDMLSHKIGELILIIYALSMFASGLLLGLIHTVMLDFFLLFWDKQSAMQSMYDVIPESFYFISFFICSYLISKSWLHTVITFIANVVIIWGAIVLFLILPFV